MIEQFIQWMGFEFILINFKENKGFNQLIFYGFLGL